MTKLKVNVPSVSELKDFLKDNSLEKLIHRFSCYDFLIGSSESLKFLKEKYDEYKEQKLNEDENI